MLGGRLPEAKNAKKICQTSGLKTGRGRLRSLNSSGLCERALGTVFDLETKRLFTKWSLPGGGRDESVDYNFNCNRRCFLCILLKCFRNQKELMLANHTFRGSPICKIN